MSILPSFWRRNFLHYELALSVVVALCFYFVSVNNMGLPSNWQFLKDHRFGIYSTLASIFGSLLGFEITAGAAAFGGMSSERLQRVRDSVAFPELWKVFKAGIRSLALTTVFVVAAMFSDRDTSISEWIPFVVAFLVVLSALRVARSGWILLSIVQIVTRP